MSQSKFENQYKNQYSLQYRKNLVTKYKENPQYSSYIPVIIQPFQTKLQTLKQQFHIVKQTDIISHLKIYFERLFKEQYPNEKDALFLFIGNSNKQVTPLSQIGDLYQPYKDEDDEILYIFYHSQEISGF